MTTAWFSLHRRLLLLLLGGVSACWLITLGWSYVDAHHEIDELFDAQLVQTAQALFAQRHAFKDKEHDDDDDPHEVLEQERVVHPYQSQVLFQIWHRDRQLAVRSTNAPAEVLTDTDGLSEVKRDDGLWRVYSQWDRHHRHRVIVAEKHHGREELAGKIARRLLTPALLGLPLLGLWVWLSTRRGLSPLNAVAMQIAAREPGRLEAVGLRRAPVEIKPLIDAINQLFARVDQTLAMEKHFTADAAHELRTPLAALAAQAQVALRARDDDERRHALEQLIASSRRATRLVEQLLTLARLDPNDTTGHAPLRLDLLAQEVCGDHGGFALDQGVELELDAEPTTVVGNADMLRILLRNLVDNAIRYTPAGGRISVTVAGDALSVTDDGPGIPPEARQSVFDRFHRLAGQNSEGSGLGLSIAARIAERHDARITLDAGPAGKGLSVAVQFPVSARPKPGAVA